MGRRPEEVEERRRGPTWGSPGRRRSSWPAALLAAAVLSSGFLLGQAQPTPVIVEPAKPLEGRDVTLTPGPEPSSILCQWFRGEQAETNRIFSYLSSPPLLQNGPSFTGRETAGPGCSLHIRSLMVSDTGIYTVSNVAPGRLPETLHAYVEVSEKLSSPVLWPAQIFVEEHADVTLNCTTSEHSGVAVSWTKDGKAIPTKAVLSERHRALTVPDVSRDDAGTYTCWAWNVANGAWSNPSKISVTQPHATLAVGAVSAIILGSLAVAALGGTLLYCFFRARRQKNRSSKQMKPTSPGYENTCPSAQTQAVPVSSSVINNTYEELQHRSRDVYDQLRR